MTNRLIHETSPYLLQHAHNPVDWYPWGEKALQKAQERQVPILLSIGYSACHWCHVMERETFENVDIAKYMNEYFVCIKVDREERPDIDEIYMIATVSMNQGQGGWPMTVFMTPDQEPFFAGTYFPPEDREHTPGFKTILQQIAYAWKEKRDVLHTTAMNISRQLRAAYQSAAKGSVNLEKGCNAALEYWKHHFDSTYGGFSKAPKFPPPTTLRLLHRLYVERQDPYLLEMACTTLDGMARGGICDHLGGGFARYSTDSYWFVPHFEKMLYDNALLAQSYLEAFQITQNPWYRQVAYETLSFVLRDMTSSEGGFLSSIDADSEGVEGKYYVWSAQEFREILLPEECELATRYFGVTEEGNWEENNILYLTQTLQSLSEECKISYNHCYKVITSAKRKLLIARQRRVRPGLDDKILTSWNALMIGAMAEGYRILREPSFLEAAKLAADFILSTLTKEESLLRTYRSGKAHLNAYLQDYAYLIDALIKLYEAGASYYYLEHALKFAERLIENFLDPLSGAFNSTSHAHEKLFFKYREGSDSELPNPNAVAAECLVRLHHHFERPQFLDIAKQSLLAYGQHVTDYPHGYASNLLALDTLEHPPLICVLAGDEEKLLFEEFYVELARFSLPHHILVHGTSENLHPHLKGKKQDLKQSILYLCSRNTCHSAIKNPSEIENVLKPQSS